jgi:hypothetical protein
LTTSGRKAFAVHIQELKILAGMVDDQALSST